MGATAAAVRTGAAGGFGNAYAQPRAGGMFARMDPDIASSPATPSEPTDAQRRVDEVFFGEGEG